MRKKRGRSEKKKDWLGKTYIQHYGADGKKSGRSERKKDWLGNVYTQHFGASGGRAGKSEKKKGWLGNAYTQKYDAAGKKRGRSEEKQGLLGGKYTQHYDSGGRATDRSEVRTGWLGGKYMERYSNPGRGSSSYPSEFKRHRGNPEDQASGEDPGIPQLLPVYIPDRESWRSRDKADQRSVRLAIAVAIGLGILSSAAIAVRVLRGPSDRRPAATDSPSAVQSIGALPVCPDARVIVMSLVRQHIEDYLALHEECWSGSVQFVEGSLSNDYPTISHVGDDRGEWFQLLFADGTVSPVIRTDGPLDGVYTPVFVGHRFQIRGTGRVKIIYELRNGPPAPEPSVTAAEARPDGELDYSTENRVETDSAPAPPEAETPRSEAPLGEAGNVPEAEEIIFVGTVLSSESEDERVLVLVKTTEGRYAASADTGSWSEVTGMSGGEPWELEGERVRVTGRECRGTLICITRIELLAR